MPPADTQQARLASRYAYLEKREQLKLAELRHQVAEEQEELRNNPSLTEREKREFARNAETLRLAEARAAIDDRNEGFFIPDATNLNESKLEVLNKRNKNEAYKSEVQEWEETQASKIKAQIRKPERTQEDDYEFVFAEDAAVKFNADIKLESPEKKALQEQLDLAEKKARSIQEVRESLPVYQYKKDLMSAIDQHSVLILVGETGSGKTTQSTQFLYELLENKGDHTSMIACTQPRRVAAMSVAKRVAEEVGCRLGTTVGYTIRFEDKTSEKTRIKYMTDGMLLRLVLTNPTLEGYYSIIIDEAHERTVATDLLLAILKQIVALRPDDFRLVISSATLNAAHFSDYFNKAPIFSIPGRTFPVTRLYTQQPEANYITATVSTALQIAISQGPGNILCFLTGEDEVTTVCTMLEETCRKLGSKAGEMRILPLYSALDQELQAKVFEPVPPSIRKIVVSTNIAESSVTIDGIKFVIDCGYSKENHYDSRTGMESLVVTPISRASANQRAGRAGRQSAGVAMALYTKHSFWHELPESHLPEIQRVALAGPILTLKSMGINDLVGFDWLDAPSPEALMESLSSLYALGALASDGSLTVVGRKLAQFPLNEMLAKAILEADKLSCVNEVLTIVAAVSESGALFLRPKDKQLYADAAKRNFTSAEGDHITLLNVYNAFVESEYDPLWCKENYLQYRCLVRIRDVRDQLVKLCDFVEVDPTSSAGTDTITIRKAITAGFFAHAARLEKNGKNYRTVRNGLTVMIHPSSVLISKTGPSSLPKWIVYHELVLTSNEYMRNVSIIDPAWLNELAPFFFKDGEIEKLGVDKKMGKGKGKVGVDGR